MATEVDLPYIGQTGENAAVTTTLGKDSWKAQWADQVEESKYFSPPSIINIPLAVLSLFFCPVLGILAVIFAIEARFEYKQEHYLESEALSERAQGTSCYAITIGIGLILGFGILLGVGARLDWF